LSSAPAHVGTEPRQPSSFFSVLGGYLPTLVLSHDDKHLPKAGDFLALGQMTSNTVRNKNMADARTERRRAIRVQPADERRLALNVSLPVKVLDVSRSGVLLGSKTELTIGDRAELRASVGPRSLTVTIEIRHLSTDPKARGGLQFRAGAVFVMLTAEQRLLLEQLLGAEPT
jgi:hypothetical protein